MATLQSLADDMRKVARNVETMASDAAVEVAKTILADVTVRTPVDTSKAASNWQASISEPVNSEIDAYNPGVAGSTAQSSVDEAYRAGVSVMQAKKSGESIFISNVTQYIEYLNRGSSTQAPAGFVERAVMLGKNKLKDIEVRLVHSGR